MSTAAMSFGAACAIAFSGLIASAQPPMSSLANDDDLVQRLLTSDEASPIAYQAMRRLEARTERHNADGWLDAWTGLRPDSGFRYRVIAEGGSSLIRGRVLKKALDRMIFHHLSVNGRDLDGERGACATVETGTPSSLTPAAASGERPGSHVD